MKLIRLLIVAVTATFLCATAMAGDKSDAKYTPGSCCDKAAKDGKKCTHPCCVAAEKEGKVCDHCNKAKKKKKSE